MKVLAMDHLDFRRHGLYTRKQASARVRHRDIGDWLERKQALIWDLSFWLDIFWGIVLRHLERGWMNDCITTMADL